VTVLLRHAVPVAAVVGYNDVRRIAEMERDLTDVALVLTRAATDNGRRTARDDAIAAFGFTRDELATTRSRPSASPETSSPHSMIPPESALCPLAARDGAQRYGSPTPR
jgi:hypothetical protein